ncbi:MAG: selenocysteine-specific translation elongation factor [Deltaproteobacteria bacterium]|nr:selenocysteine-specific translation elongation factor [Deltaproteobacteria bacterium]MBW2070183.1 selenocysteine-specific translation elongation factor [Deltaproteobacteria bacterium]
MKQIILGTAGHIDHGKTTLIKALTGIDTDRLKEEKERGITIELGFAHLRLPNEQIIGIVDVPGHEKFVKHMVAGATGLDLVALVVAADEGVMPQTREHLEICELLKVKQGLVILTKIDLVDDPDWLELVQEDLRDFLQGTFLASAAIVPVSAVTGQGLSQLVEELQELCEKVEARSSGGDFRLAVDRVFTMRGFGTVVTGTAVSGKVRTGDTLLLYPQGLQTKVRGLQVHNQEVSEAVSGQRTAINLQGVEKAVVRRGDVLATPDSLIPSYMVDVRLQHLESAPRVLKNRAKVRFHTGTSEMIATCILLDNEQLAPGASGFAQMRFDEPVAVRRGDRFVVRSYSPVRTIGGGQILHPAPVKRKRLVPATLKALETLESADAVKMLRLHLEEAGYKGIRLQELNIRTNLPRKEFDQALQQLLSKGEAIQFDRDARRVVGSRVMAKLKQFLEEQLHRFHKREPLRSGMNKEELFARMPKGVDAKLFNELIQRLVSRGEIVQEKEVVRLSSHQVSLGKDQEDIRGKIEDIYRQAGLQPPFFREVTERLGVPVEQASQVLAWMLEQGILVKIKNDMFFHHEPLKDLKTRLLQFFESHAEITTPQFKKLTETSRKYTIPLLEYLDATRFTIRVGDIRRLREKRRAG